MGLVEVQLPAEILKQIFHLLPGRDLRLAVQVCRLWREAGEAPGLWAREVVCLARGGEATPALSVGCSSAELLEIAREIDSVQARREPRAASREPRRLP